MTTKFILRILDAAGQLLGWTEVYAHARGDGALWIDGPVQIGVEVAGQPATVSLHWVDVHVEQRQPLQWPAVQPGQIITLQWQQPAWVVGQPANGLPPVTVRGPVGVAVPVGSMGAKT